MSNWSLRFQSVYFSSALSDLCDEDYQAGLEEYDGYKEYATFPEFCCFIVLEGCYWEDIWSTTENVCLIVEECL